MTIEFALEPAERVIEDAVALFSAHWQECACWQDRVSLNVDKERYIAGDKTGAVRGYTMRDEGMLVGYMGLIVGKHMHYKDDVFAAVDVLYIDPEYRKGLAAIRFMKWVEEQVKESGASVMTYHIKTFHDYPALFERLGYEKIEVIYAKCVKE